MVPCDLFRVLLEQVTFVSLIMRDLQSTINVKSECKQCYYYIITIQAVEEETCESDGIELSLVDQMQEMAITDSAIAAQSGEETSGGGVTLTQSKSSISDRKFVSTKVSSGEGTS